MEWSVAPTGLMLASVLQIVLVLIEQYLDLKAGEVWAEVVEELDAEGVIPVDVSWCQLQ